MSTRDDFLEHFLRHEADLKAFIGSLVPDSHLRADVFQDVALTLWQQIDSYDPARATGPQAQDRRQAGDRVTVGPRSVVVLSGPRPPAQA